MVRGLLVASKQHCSLTVSALMGEGMSSVLSAFVMWLLASVPFALCIGWFCSLNQLSLDENAAPILPVEPHELSGNNAHLDAALRAIRPNADIAPA